MIIRLAHWQLEAGVRDGLAEAAAEYERLHPNVRIVQEAIPESTYGQWMSTQLMGGTAPDIVQAGMVEGHLMTAFFIRYFVPLSRYVTRPNPYNAGTDLEKVPLIRTFKDGMRRSFIDETQEFMTVPLALTGVRLFYNKPLLKKLTGLDEAPADYRAFLEVCEKIRVAKAAERSAVRGDRRIALSLYALGRESDQAANIPGCARDRFQPRWTLQQRGNVLGLRERQDQLCPSCV